MCERPVRRLHRLRRRGVRRRLLPDHGGHHLDDGQGRHLLALLASEILAVTGKTPSQHYAELEAEFGKSYYAREDADADREQKARLAQLSSDDVTVDELAGEPITAVLSHAPGNGAAIGGIKVTTENAWFAARPSGTEDKYKIYAESLKSAEHLAQVQSAAKTLVDAALTPGNRA